VVLSGAPTADLNTVPHHLADSGLARSKSSALDVPLGGRVAPIASQRREIVTEAGGTTVEVVRIRISDAGRRALEG
jgi:hypothetical protein